MNVIALHVKAPFGCHRAYTNAQRADIFDKHVNQGMSYSTIGTEYGVSRNAIAGVIRRWREVHEIQPVYRVFPKKRIC